MAVNCNINLAFFFENFLPNMIVQFYYVHDVTNVFYV